MTAFAEFQDVGGVMLADPSLTENANVNVVFNNDAGADYPNYYIIMGNATETPLPLSSITSQIINVNASNGIFVGGSLFDGAEVAYDPQTNSFAISNVPEPATYAAIFGALALAFAAYRRRK